MRSARLLVAAFAAGLALGGCGTSGSGGGGSGRPVPSAPGTPIGSPSTGAVGAGGGTLASSDGYLVVEVPAGALPAATTLTAQQVTNTAPGGVGPSWRLGPEGTLFGRPVSITLYAGTAGRPLDELTVTYQGDDGFWHRVPPSEASSDPVARTLTVRTLHFSSWTLTTTPTARDLTGTFTLTTVLGSQIVTPGIATYTFAGEDALGQYYVSSGTITLPSFSEGSATCSVAPPETPGLDLRTNIAELSKSSTPTLAWGASGHWNVSCTDGTTELVTVGFDTQGINMVGCTPTWVTPEVSGVDSSSGTLTWDCSAKARGQITGSWSYLSAACGTPCVPQNPCKTGTVQCGSGAAVCVETGDVANGTTCGPTGSNLVCNAGTCVSCVAGLSCTSNPTLCAKGVTSCATGTSVCVDVVPLTPADNGTPCGGGQVCNAGTCVPCTSGLSCSTNPTACYAGVTSCLTGTSTCVDATPLAPLADGTICGNGLACTAGTCACASGSSCTGQPSPCYTGVTDCQTGSPVCTNGIPLADGTSCGGTNACSAGTCVAARTVSGTRLATWWPDTGVQAPAVAPDVAAGTAKIQAWVPAGAGWASFPGTLTAATGAYSIPGVPVGPYLLQLTDGSGSVTVFAGSGDAVDLGYDALGRSGQAPASASTPVTIALAGLTPWTTGDQLQITASNADVWDTLATSSILPGDTGASSVEDWFARNAGEGALSLLAPADVLFVHQLIPQTDGTSTLPYLSASGYTSVTGASLTSGLAATLTAAAMSGLSPATGSLPAVTWDLASFEALASGMTGAGPASAGHVLAVGAAVGISSVTAPWALGTPTMLEMQVAAGSPGPLAVGPLTYGQFLPASLWAEWRSVDFSETVTYVGPGSPAPSALPVQVAVGQRELLSTATTTLAPSLAPVQGPVIISTAGVSSNAFSTLTGVGLTPSFSWLPPATGVPTRYTVDVFQLGASGSVTTASRVVSLVTTGTSVTVPPGLLEAGALYFARITAWSYAPDSLAAVPPAPLRSPGVFARAETLTGTFAP